MHGLINRSIQCFLRDTYGPARWLEVSRRAALGIDSFESLLTYDDSMTDRLIAAASATLGRPPESILEDLGTYLVSHPNSRALRRLLRFGGVSFLDFLHSLEELPDRARLAVPDLELPEVEIEEMADGVFQLKVGPGFVGALQVVTGLLRAMADDYGALVLLDQSEADQRQLSVRVLDHAFSEGRHFQLRAEEPQ